MFETYMKSVEKSADDPDVIGARLREVHNDEKSFADNIFKVWDMMQQIKSTLAARPADWLKRKCFASPTKL